MATSPSYNQDTAARLDTARYADAARSSTEGPSPAQWAAVKDEIRILYEKKPLRDVRAILDRQYGFKAT
jgi:hypothetical protein